MLNRLELVKNVMQIMHFTLIAYAQVPVSAVTRLALQVDFNRHCTKNISQKASGLHQVSLIATRCQTDISNHPKRYPRCDWLKISYCTNKVTYCKYVSRASPHHGRPQGEQNGHSPLLLEIGTNNQNFLANLKQELHSD